VRSLSPCGALYIRAYFLSSSEGFPSTFLIFQDMFEFFSRFFFPPTLNRPSCDPADLGIGDLLLILTLSPHSAPAIFPTLKVHFSRFLYRLPTPLFPPPPSVLVSYLFQPPFEIYFVSHHPVCSFYEFPCDYFFSCSLHVFFSRVLGLFRPRFYVPLSYRAPKSRLPLDISLLHATLPSAFIAVRLLLSCLFSSHSQNWY